MKKTDRNPLLAGFATCQGHQTALEEGSATLQGLPLSMPAPATLDQALSAIHDEFTPCRDAEFRILVNGQPKTLEPTIQEQVYLIMQEALLNALRHSGATNIEAEVEYLPHRLRLSVRDNGRGIDPEVMRSGHESHWGLLGMKERAVSIGAKLRIWSGPGVGTDVEISVPHPLAEIRYG